MTHRVFACSTAGGGRDSRGVGPGVELFALCQSASADGSLSPAEIDRLRSWRAQTRGTEIPSWGFVGTVVDHVLDVGKVAPAELPALRQALDPVLPAELHRPGMARIAAREPTLRPELDDTERRHNEILASAHFVVAGCQCDDTKAVIARHAREGEPVLLVRDEHETCSANAIRVCAPNGKPIGYVPEAHARELAPLLDRGARYRAHLVSCVQGSHARVLVVQAYLYAAGATLGLQAAGSRKIPRRRGSAGVWFARVAIGLLIAAAVAAVLRL